MSQTAMPPVDWDAIDTVLVDMDGTLLDLAFDNFFWLELVPERYAARHGLPLELASRRLATRFEEIRGTLPWYCVDHWTRDLELDIEALKREHRHRICFLPGALEFLAAVRARGKSVCIVTDAHRTTFAVKAEQTGIDRLVDGVVCSHDLQAPKQSAAFWNELQRVRPFDRERTLFIDDSLPVLRAASGHGVRYTLAIRRPDSRQPARTIEEFVAVGGVADLV